MAPASSSSTEPAKPGEFPQYDPIALPPDEGVSDAPGRDDDKRLEVGPQLPTIPGATATPGEDAAMPPGCSQGFDGTLDYSGLPEEAEQMALSVNLITDAIQNPDIVAQSAQCLKT